MNTKLVPMCYKIVLSSNDSIPLDNFDDVLDVYEKMKKAGKGTSIITPNGMFNISFYIAIIPDYKRWKTQAEYYQMHQRLPESEVSEFAKLLAPKMKMLSDQDRTDAQIEASLEERKFQ